MSDLTIVATALDDLGGPWHSVVLHDAEHIGPALVRCNGIDTVCGIQFTEGSTTVSLVDTGAPDAPTCPACLDGLPANMVSIADRLVRSLPVREAVAA